VPDTAQNSAEPRTDFEKYMSKIEVPFPNAFSPFIYGDSLYFSAAKMGAADLLQNMLIRYDMNTKESEIIFDLSNKRCIIQSISANENWLVWSVSEEFGSYCDAYIKNLKTGKINKIYSRTYEAAAWIVPCLMGDCVYWIEEQEYSDGRISGAVIKYDCLTNTRTELQKLHEIGLYSLNLHANDGMLIWTDVLSDGAYYFLHNIKSGETISFKAKRRIAGYVQYANGLIFSTEFDDFEIGPAYSCVIDVKTKEYLEPNNLFRLSSIKRVSGNFLASKADGINVFKIEDTTIKGRREEIEIKVKCRFLKKARV